MRKILISAYSCVPGRGSEPGAGWAMVEAAAQHNEVWVLTMAEQAPEIDAYLDQHPNLKERVHPVYIALRGPLERSKRRGDFYWHYPLWQVVAGRRARALHERIGFDVMHHATFAADWQFAGLVMVKDVPLVWGPVGGATYPSLSVVREWLSPGQAPNEVVRSVTTRAFRRLFADPVARRAALVVAMNRDTERRFSGARRVIVEGNACIRRTPVEAGTPTALEAGQSANRHAVFVGMLYGWKGMSLAIRAMAEQDAQDWDLTIIGDGPDMDDLVQLVDELDLRDRVFFAGRLPRESVNATFAVADAMIFPSLHDSLSWAVAEAVTFGCPVVCLDLGGPPVAMDGGGIAVPPHGDIPAALATALARTTERIPPSDRFSPDRLPAMLDDWYSTASQA